MLTPGIKTGICFWKGLRLCQPRQQGQSKPASLSAWERSPLHRLTSLLGLAGVYTHECEWSAPWTKDIQVKIAGVSPSVFHIRCAGGVSACAYPGLGEINKAALTLPSSVTDASCSRAPGDRRDLLTSKVDAADLCMYKHCFQRNPSNPQSESMCSCFQYSSTKVGYHVSKNEKRCLSRDRLLTVPKRK